MNLRFSGKKLKRRVFVGENLKFWNFLLRNLTFLNDSLLSEIKLFIAVIKSS